MKKVALYLATGFEEIEALATVDILRRGDIEVDVVSIEETLEVVGSHKIKVFADKLIKDINLEDYQMIVLPGGMPGTLNLNDSEILKTQILEFYKNKKYIGAICAAPMILGKMKLLVGKEATCYPGVEDNLEGAIYRSDLDVIVAENIITSRGAGTAMKFGLKLVELLEGKEVSDKLTKSLLV
ncbi:MAG: DJ-1 family protein [Fusobacteria bacterium]|nr:MAG: DJ-1 family protein [Fusobacteriota bacterium]